MIDFQKKLDKQKQLHLFRSLAIADEMSIDFYSNDYLGYARMMRVGQLLEAVQPIGATGSALISGYTDTHREVEDTVASMFGWEAVTLFPSGYQANIGVVSAIAGREQVILYDEYVHASIQDGMRLSTANRFKFKHNNLLHLEQLLVKHQEASVIVIVESLYSMTGQYVSLTQLMQLKEKYGFVLIIDEAHAVGVAGDGRRGLVNSQCEDVIKIITFGKAFGFSGAAVLSSALIKSYLVNFSRPFIFSTAMPVSHVKTISSLVQHLASDTTTPALLTSVITNYLKMVENSNLPFNFTKNAGPIQFVHVPDYKTLMRLNQQMSSFGLAVKAIRPPTVPEGSAGFRICLHAFNTESELERLFNTETWQS